MSSIIGGTTGVTFPDGTTQATAATTPTAVANLSGGSAGVIPYQTGSGATSFTAAGTSGQVLTSAGTGTPTWTSPSAGAMTLISTQTASSSSSLSWTALGSTYVSYFLIVTNLTVSTKYQRIYIQYGTGSSPTWQTSNYTYYGQYNASGAVNPFQQTTTPGFDITFGQGSTNNSGSLGLGTNVVANIYNISNSSAASISMNGWSQYDSGSGANGSSGTVAGNLYISTPITAIRLVSASGNLASGTATLYGISS